jgi:hypothetical protein
LRSRLQLENEIRRLFTIRYATISENGIIPKSWSKKILLTTKMLYLVNRDVSGSLDYSKLDSIFNKQL